MYDEKLFAVVYTEVMKDYTREYVSTDPAPWEEVSAKFNTTNFETRKPVDDFSELSARSRLQVDQSAKSKSIENWLDNNVNTGDECLPSSFILKTSTSSQLI